MKKAIVFRIVEIPTHQVLLTKVYDEKEDKDAVEITCFVQDGIKANLTFGFDNVSERDNMFDNFTPKQAAEIVLDINKIMQDEKEN